MTNDDPVTRPRSTFWEASKDQYDDHDDQDDATYQKGYVGFVDRKAALGYPTGDLPDMVARELVIELVGHIVALIDNVSDDTAVRAVSLLGEMFESSNLLKRDIAIRIAYSSFGHTGMELTRIITDDNADNDDRIKAALQLQKMTLEAIAKQDGDE